MHSNSNQAMETWVREDLAFICQKASGTFNARMKPELYSCSAEKQELTLQFPVQDWEINGLGTLHGGVSSAMADLSMSMLVHYYAQDNIPPTISQTTNFLRPVPAEGGVLVFCRLTSLGKRVASVYSEVLAGGSQKLACTSVGTYSIIPKEVKHI